MILKKKDSHLGIMNLKLGIRNLCYALTLSISKKQFIKFVNFTFLIFNFALFSGCYSFRGISIDPSWKTFYVSNFQAQVSGGPANLPIVMTDKLRDYFQRNTSLRISQQNPDLMFEGTIIEYEATPQAATSSDKAGINRLSIKIQVKLTNAKNDEKSYDQEFSFFMDFPQNQTLNQVERDLFPKILDRIVEDIFTKTAGDW